MSFQATTWAVTQDVKSSPAKFILMLLANYADADGYTFVGQTTIAEDASMSKRTVVRHMATLEERGLITRKRRFREDGSRSSDGVFLNLERPADQPSAKETSGQKEHGPSDTSGRGQVSECHSNNLSEEQSVKSKDDPFEVFWKAYPHPKNRGSKPLARDRFGRCNVDEVMTALKGYIAYCNHPDQRGWYPGKAACYWLSRDHWKGFLPEKAAEIDHSNVVTVGTPEHAALAAWKRKKGLPVFDLMPIPEGYHPPEETTP